ncbi:MAG TPA: hypothetical protein DCS07_00380 [Bdellovibrionales bacterium]|nr:MAG: hypothetical protein A2Z97_15455 [Bdellovibrionales bacterium GWB1_52_6]OFZ04257.1 MAG: hypothetical protein A2X97_06310 [Bdellovibrionales bacterium GWA1_52_35]OFZ42922.1 MAG: hypothetical protein A2070_04645 [Bdellovibrionales bacterium GWC1_52_8]HAR41086.1 hypothetical protein [Bdellovibrionales bacterium]HCM40897.1 hypothetical protein [Bdellovibrionales bacterium]
MLYLGFLASPAWAETPGSLDLKILENQLGNLKGATEPACSSCAEKPDSNLCQDLRKFSCAPGDFDDGTGIGVTGNIIQQKVADLRSKSRNTFIEGFSKRLGSADESYEYLRKLAQSTLGLVDAPQCKNQLRDPACVKLLSSGLADISLKRVFPSAELQMTGASSFIFGYSLRDIDLLTQNSLYENIEADLSKGVQRAITDQTMQKKIAKKIFPDIRMLIAAKIKENVADPNTQRQLIDKVNGIQFGGVDCTLMGGYMGALSVSINSLIIPNAYYQHNKNEFRYCNGFLLGNQSEFQIAMVIAHELAHSIDPCNIAKGPSAFRFNYSSKEEVNAEKEYPFQGLLECLRKEDSVRASKMPVNPQIAVEQKKIADLKAAIEEIKRAIAKIEKKLKKSSLDPKERVVLREKNLTLKEELMEKKSELDKLSGGVGFGTSLVKTENPLFCDGDQIGEAFSDWLAYEVIPDYMASKHPSLTEEQFQTGYANAFRGFCNTMEQGIPQVRGQEVAFDVHPAMEDRINSMLLASPKIRAQMGCKAPSKRRYCPALPGGKTK